MKTLTKFLTVFCLLASSFDLPAQQTGLTWLKTFGAQGFESSPGFVADQAGNYYLAITFEKEIGFNLNNTDTIIYSRGGTDAVVLKITTNGTIHDCWHLTSKGHVAATGIDIRNNHIAISGSFQDTLFLVHNAYEYAILTTEKSLSGFYLEIAPDGQLIYSSGLAGLSARSTLQNLSSNGETSVASGTIQNDSIRRTDNFLYIRNSNTDSVVQFQDVSKLTINGTGFWNEKLVIFGSFSDSLVFGNQFRTNSAGKDSFAVILDPDTDEYQILSYHSLRHAEVATVTASGEYLWLAVNFSDTLLLTGTPPISVISQDASDILLLKYDSQLNLLDWYHIGGNLPSRANRIFTAYDKLFLLGNIASPLTEIDHNDSMVFQFGQPNIRGNATLISIDSANNCELVWMIHQDWIVKIASVHKFGQDETVLAGVFYDKMTIDSTDYQSAGSQDAFMLRIGDACLNVLKSSPQTITFCEGDSVLVNHYHHSGNGKLIYQGLNYNGTYISKPGRYWIEGKLPCGCPAADTIIFEMLKPGTLSDASKPFMNSKVLSFEPGTTELWITYCGKCEIQDKNNLFSSKVTPNPIFTDAVMEIFLPERAFVSIRLLTSGGELISTVSEQHFAEGKHVVNLPTTVLAGGTYLLKVQFMLEQHQQSQTHKIIKL